MPKKLERTGKTASVDIEDNVPVGIPNDDIPVGTKSPKVLIAENEGRMVKTQETTAGEDGTVVTTHTRPGTLIMYKPTERHGYVPKRVSGSAVRLLLVQGWQEVCPECSSRHVDKDGIESTDPNLCSAREPLAVRVCRVCSKRIYDNLGFTDEGESVESDDPNVIQDDVYTSTTPAQRTEASLNLHYWLRHPRQAQMMNLPPLPVAMRDMVEETRAG